jgi:molybdenum cofactor cytidylyltransferase
MIPAIVLAAGRSSRMGRPKALLPIGASGDTFLTRILHVLRGGGITRVCVVVGGDAGAVLPKLPSNDEFLRVVENENYEQGQLSSLLVGLSSVEESGDDVEAVMVTLVDLPLITAGTVRAVLDAYRNAPGAPIVRPRKGNRHGHPAIFDRRLFAELKGADPATGAKPVVHAHTAEEVNVDVADDGAFTDIDTPEDYERFIRPTLSQATETLSKATETQRHRDG